jgi:tRNA pseudouridine55 synthase
MMNGWIVIDKPLRLTSTQVGQRLKKILNIKKIGHLGTLDPLASGVLIFALGEATKLIPYLKKDKKIYECVVTFGQSTTTDDLEGEIIEKSDYVPSIEEIQKALGDFIGVIEQKPPAFSAVHVNGKRAYTLAREGKIFDLPLRKVRIDHITLIDHSNNAIRLRVTCGSGVYIRSIARDLAKKLGTCGYISYLRRLQDDCFLISDAFLLEKIVEIRDKLKVRGVIHPMEKVLDDIPVVSVNQEIESLLRQGQVASFQNDDTDVVFVISHGRPVCLARQFESRLIPKRVFN